MDYKKLYEEWLSNPYFDEETKAELKAIEQDENEIKERFYKELEFGTAGLRGVIGAGTNRMNIYTVRKTTQGLANYIAAVNGQEKGVAIAHDSRRMSPEFAKEAALCLAANGVKAYIFDSLRPTPELSYAVRKLGCIAGINITASHNPPEYNGYKVYWEDGAQITPPHDSGIMAEVKKVTDFSEVKTMPEEEAKKAGLYVVIGAEIDDKYIAELKKQVIHWDSIKEAAKDLTIVYTPLHGTGNIPARRVLKEIGFDNVYVVPEQELPDGEFPTVSYPNPEAKEAFELALKLAKEKNAEMCIRDRVCSTKLNYGPMAKFEKNAIETGDLFSNKEEVVTEDLGLNGKRATKGKVYDLVIPILALIICTILAMIYTGGGFNGECSWIESFGNCDASLSLVLGSFLALVVTFILFIPRKVLSFRDFMNGITEGIKSMVPAFTILILAWTIGGICSVDYLNTGGYVGNLVNSSNFPVFLLPVVTFAVAGFLGFSTGTSWGTMALLIPIGAAITLTPETEGLLLPIFGSILAGAVYGDHVSPISDTTILSSTGAGCNHLDHVSTQLVYASTVAVCCAVGYILMGLMGSFLIPLIISAVLLLVVLFALNKMHAKKEEIDYSHVKY